MTILYSTFRELEIPEFGIGLPLEPRTSHFDNTAFLGNYHINIRFKVTGTAVKQLAGVLVANAILRLSKLSWETII